MENKDGFGSIWSKCWMYIRKDQFVCKYMKKITMEIWMDLDGFGLIWS